MKQSPWVNHHKPRQNHKPAYFELLKGRSTIIFIYVSRDYPRTCHLVDATKEKKKKVEFKVVWFETRTRIVILWLIQNRIMCQIWE